MDFDDAKENIQPLAQGRNASILHASLRLESPQELLARRKELEKEIRCYHGDDPLSVWYNYIEWIEQSFPSSGKESGLEEVLSKCLIRFENDERYKQDRRMIKLYIKFIDSHKDPAECYQQLFSAGIGTMVADFYIAWAYCYDLIGNVRKADEIFVRGISCRAQPLEELQEARHHFGFAVAQRLMYKEDDTIREETNRQLQERRKTLTSLRGHSRKQIVGSIRTGSVVKSLSPGKVKTDLPSTSAQRGNTRVQVYKGENENQNVTVTPSIDSNSTNEVCQSVVRSIINAARNQENEKEPGPWNKANDCKKKKLFSKHTKVNELGFEIHEDGLDNSFENIRPPCIPPIPIDINEIKFDKPFIYPAMFCATSKPIKGWITPVTTEDAPCQNAIPAYNKCKLYPRPNMEFQPEELKAYNILKKRGIQNEFTNERVVYWGCGPKYNIRLYPHFAAQSKPQKTDSMDQLYIPEKIPGLKVAFEEIYNKEDNTERQFEEILFMRIKRNETIIKTTEMDETMCVTSEKMRPRKSFFPIRKSLAPSTFNYLNKISVMQDHNKEDAKFTNNELSYNASVCSAHVESEVDEFKTKEDTFNKNTSQRVIPQTFVRESVCSTIPADSEHNELKTKEDILNEKTSQKEIPQTLRTEMVCSKTTPADFEHNPNVEEIPKLLGVQNETDRVSSKPFEIFTDGIAEEMKSLSVTTDSAVPEGYDFQFKTPSLPNANTILAGAVSSKLPFEIFDDENLVQNNLNSIPKPDFGCAGGFFDPEETCSTQTFNIFLKAQSVSTPKTVTRLQPQRQFGNVLKEVVSSPSLLEQKDQKSDHHLSSPADNRNHIVGSATVAAYSPLQRQLSTILETSEHGSTQGTHTTGATTKSTLSSPEFDIESQVQTTTSTGGCNQPYAMLETVKELSCEVSNVDEVINSLKIQNNNDGKIKTTEKEIELAGGMRLQYKCSSGGLNFSIFEDSIRKDQVQVGNFSRLEEKEDTAAGLVFKTLPSIRFQDDKTETIPKMLITSQQCKFQDDKTETISKIMFEPMVPAQFQEEKTETMSRILRPPQPIKFDEDIAEIIPDFSLTPSKATQVKDEKTKVIVTNRETCNQQEENVDKEDSFEFFRYTPPKPAKQMERGLLCHFDRKRFCDKNIPEVQESKLLSKPTSVFEDIKNKLSTNLKFNLNDSPLPPFPLVEESHSALELNKSKPKSKSVFRDSFIPDFSIVDDAQTKAKQVQSENQHSTINESILPEFSQIQNIPSASSKLLAHTNSLKFSLSDFTQGTETQSIESIVKSMKPVEHTSIYLDQSSRHSSSVQKNFLNTDVREKRIDDIKSQQTSIHGPVSNMAKDDKTLKKILTDTFMKGFSEINELPPPVPNSIKEIPLLQPNKKNSSLRFLNESLKKNSEHPGNICENNSKISNISGIKDTKLNFLVTEAPSDKFSSKEKGLDGCGEDKYFEFNCETEMFATNISMIKNSTWLPNHEPSVFGNAKQLSQIQQNSLHIKSEEVSSNSHSSWSTLKNPHEILKPDDSSKAKQNFAIDSFKNDFSIELSASELVAIKGKSFPNHMRNSNTTSGEQNDCDDCDDCENSIYYKQTSTTPKAQLHIWDDADAYKTTDRNIYIHTEPDFNQTHEVIENMCIDPNVNPFNVDLINAFLEQHDVISFVESLPSCKLVGCIQRIKQNVTIDINGNIFNVLKLIGEGAYGAVYCGKEARTGKLMAMKQEKPPNFWEYYICLEVQERIRTDEMLQAYMSVDYALIGNNSSILISNFSPYGSIITVCNTIKKHTLKNVDEYVVMLLASELLEIMDHLHAVNIIHADVKADNFLLMKKLTYPPTERHLQLIDFGVSIDMKLFKQGQTFSFVHNDNSFKCPEMRERRPWTYQLDLYGLAGVFHVLLFGKYMDIEKKARGFWMHKTHVPRYLNKNLWDEIFKTLLNVRDCNSMPNLQDLRGLLKKEMEEKDKYVHKMVNEFNKALSL